MEILTQVHSGSFEGVAFQTHFKVKLKKNNED